MLLDRSDNGDEWGEDQDARAEPQWPYDTPSIFAAREPTTDTRRGEIALVGSVKNRKPAALDSPALQISAWAYTVSGAPPVFRWETGFEWGGSDYEPQTSQVFMLLPPVRTASPSRARSAPAHLPAGDSFVKDQVAVVAHRQNTTGNYANSIRFDDKWIDRQ